MTARSRESGRLIQDPALGDVAAKVEAGERLALADGLVCLATSDLFGLAQLADGVTRRRSGDRVFYVLNRQVNPTNLCVLSCRFCDFAARRNDDHAYEMALEEIVACGGDDIDEIHVVGGLHPQWEFEHYVEIVWALHERWPRLPIKAYTAVEIDWFTRISGRPLTEVLEILKDAGVVALPGGGAEVFSERVRRELYPRKMSHERWFEIHRTAHELGLRTNCTLLYGHIETAQERVEHLLRLRELQDETGGFLAFVPLEYQPGSTRLVARRAGPIEALRTIATARLLLDNFAHVKAYWVMLGEETAAVALNFGADDIDGTIRGERVAHFAKAESPTGLTERRLVRLIRQAGKIPVRRDALYNVLAAPAAEGVPV
jgi:aminodeoxyfutalosine synthase